LVFTDSLLVIASLSIAFVTFTTMEDSMNKGIEIVPSLTVHELLEAYPELEDVLIGIAAPFKKLKNPILRKTVAKVATIKNISSVGGVPLGELIAKLRKAVGQSPSGDFYDDDDYFGEQPDWFSPDKVMLSIEEDKLGNKDEMTLVAILRGAKDVNTGEIIELITTFLPAPGIDAMRSKGYSAWIKKADGGIIKSYFQKPTD
jgi:hypothetical protein